MPIESATYISDLVPADPNHTDGLGVADSHLRLIKSVLQATFPNLNGPVTATPAGLNAAAGSASGAGVLEIAANGTIAGGALRLDPVPTSGRALIANTGTAGASGGLTVSLYDTTDTTPTVGLTVSPAGVNAPSLMQAGAPLVPSGVVVMWWGLLSAIPAGWTLCNGTNGAPDLRDRFVMGAGLSYGEGAVGGAASVTPTTASAGSHSHGGADGVAGPWALSGTTDSQGAHSHFGSTAGFTITSNELPATQFELTFTGGSFGLPAGSTTSVVAGAGAAHYHGIVTDGAHAHNLNVSNAPAHQHSISVDGTHTHTVTVPTVPPFAALAYIMKL